MQKGQLPEGAYGSVKGSDYKPYISTSSSVKEVTVIAIFIGILASIIFSMSNVYLGIKTGITIAAGIPSGILGVGILRALRRNSILQNNIIQAMGSAGESVAGGIIFTIPAILLWGGVLDAPMIFKLLIFVTAGSALGVFILSLFRRFLIEEEHGSELKFPESMAISEVIVNASDGVVQPKGQDSGFKLLILGTIIGGVFKLIGQGLGFIKESVSIKVWNSQLSVDIFPALMGLGYIVGTRVGSIMWAGGLFSWFFLIPFIYFFGSHLTAELAPGTTMVSDMSPSEVWSSYVRYIGAGAITTAGFITLLKTFPSIVRSFMASFSKTGKGDTEGEKLRSRIEMPISIIIGMSVIAFLVIWFMPMVAVTTGPILSFLVLLAIFFFGIVSARLCGIIGVSSNPVSGMTIASLLIITSVIKLMGISGETGMFLAIFLGSAIATGVSVAGGYAQSLKVSFLLGGTSRKMAILIFLATISGTLIAILTLALMQQAYGIGSPQAPAPQGTLMRVLVEGILGGHLPWDLIILGSIISVIAFVLGIPMMLLAIGIYLPIGLTSAIFIGGLVAYFVKKSNKTEEAQKKSDQMATIFSSGLIAGDAVFGIILAALTALGISINLFGEAGFLGDNLDRIFSFVIYLAIGAFFIKKFNYTRHTQSFDSKD